jgi:hypothetical protein
VRRADDGDGKNDDENELQNLHGNASMTCMVSGLYQHIRMAGDMFSAPSSNVIMYIMKNKIWG